MAWNCGREAGERTLTDNSGPLCCVGHACCDDAQEVAGASILAQVFLSRSRASVFDTAAALGSAVSMARGDLMEAPDIQLVERGLCHVVQGRSMSHRAAYARRVGAASLMLIAAVVACAMLMTSGSAGNKVCSERIVSLFCLSTAPAIAIVGLRERCEEPGLFGPGVTTTVQVLSWIA